MATGDNNNQAVRTYSKEFKELLTAVFAKNAHFADAFGGSIEAIDGISQKDTAFSVKTSDIASALTTGSLAEGGTPAYDTGANVGMGTGTGKSSRFGNRTEIIYVDTDVKYAWDWTIHEGIDRHTVDNDFDDAVADRMELQARAKVAAFDANQAAYISSIAEQAIDIESGTPTEALVIAAFNSLHAAFINAGVDVNLTWKAKVCTDVYNILVDADLLSTSKGSTVNVDTQTVNMFKGFVIEEVPDALFAENEFVYAYVEGVGKAFTGIETLRTIESEDFDGVAFQGAGKAGEYIPDDNKAAVGKIYYDEP